MKRNSAPPSATSAVADASVTDHVEEPPQQETPKGGEGRGGGAQPAPVHSAGSREGEATANLHPAPRDPSRDLPSEDKPDRPVLVHPRPIRLSPAGKTSTVLV